MASVYFDPAVGGNGSTVTDDSNPTTGLANGGHRTRFVPALAQVVAVAGNTVTKATEAAASAAASAASATTALNAPGTQATSVTSLAVGIGSRSLTLAESNKAFVVGQFVQIVSTASTANWMVGAITAFTPGTGAMTVNVTNTGGTGTIAAWTITPTNPPELPSQSGNAGRFLTTNGSVASWAVTDIVVRSARTSNTILAAADKGSLIDITSGTFTQTFTAAATLASGWFCYIRNAGTGNITLDPNASETIDGLTSFIMYPGEVRLVQCDGAAFRTVVLKSFNATFTASGTFTKPPGYDVFGGLIWGAGGSGSKGQFYGGGGGGGCTPFLLPNASVGASVTVTIAAASTGPTSGNGVNGGNSTFGSLATGFGGAGGYFDGSSNTLGGGGGGVLGAAAQASSAQGGQPSYSPGAVSGSVNVGFGGGNGTTGVGGAAVYGGGGGGGASSGGQSLYGGGGGGGSPGSGSTTGGVSAFGGAGGAGSVTASGTDGTAPGGGGGATHTGTKAGNGARGELRIWGII